MERIYGLLGRTLGHSWSVPIHRALGCGDYRLIELEPEQLGDFLQREDIAGLNVTIPYKRDVMQFCDVIDPAAEAIGSVNTLVRRDGRLYGYNTDIDGFLYMLRRAKISLVGKKVVILGSGGASLTAQAAARQEGAREITVVSRTGPDNYENLPQRHAGAEVLVNTTPVGMWPHVEGQPVDLRLLPNISAVADVVYNPGRTNLLLQAEELDRAVQAAREARTAVVAAGLPESWESEGLDRPHLSLPEGYNTLIEAVAAANPRTVVVLLAGSPVETPWADRVAFGNSASVLKTMHRPSVVITAKSLSSVISITVASGDLSE